MFLEKEIIDQIHKNVIKLWEKQNISKRVPLFYTNLKKNALLFIGLNPSFSEKGFKRILKNTEYQHILNNLEDYYAFSNFEKKKIKDFQKIGQISKEKYKYFKKFNDLSKTVNLDWEHIDLLFMRETNQKEIVKKLNQNTKDKDKQFVHAQIDLNIQLIEELQPEIIVVQNAFASKILKDKLKLEWDDCIGTYRYFKNTPIFLSGMLTGGRALDLGSYERLKWHLKFVNEKKLRHDCLTKTKIDINIFL